MNRHSTLGARIHSRSMRHCGFVYVLFVAAQYLKSGYQLQPNFDVAVATLARDPFQSFESLPAGAHYVTTSWLMPFILHTIRIESEAMMVAAHWAVALMYLTVCYLLVRRIADCSVRLTAVVILGASPIIPASFNWLGYDTVTLLLIATIAYFARHRVAVFAIALLLGMQHFEIGTTAAVAWILVSRSLPESNLMRRISFHTSMVLGLLVGRLILILVFAANGASMEGSRIDTARELVGRATAGFLSAPFSLLWSIFGVGWFVIALGASKGVLNLRSAIAGLVTLVAISGMTLDASRVGIVSSSLVVLGGIALNPELLTKIDRRFLGWLVVAFLIVPRVWIWDGNHTGPCTPENMGQVFAWLLRRIGFLAQDCRLYWVGR